MKISSYNPRDRYRRKASDRMAGILTVLFLAGLCFGVGFWAGKQHAGYQEQVLSGQVKALKANHDVLQETITALRAEAQTVSARYEQLQVLYRETVPEGPMEDLVALLKGQLDEGRDPERLSFLIRSARPPRNCSEAKTRRFIVSTPSYKGPDSRVVVGGGALVVKGKGVSAVNIQGQPEAWYDPSKKVSIKLIVLGGKIVSKSGVMPLHHSVVIGKREHRLTITDGARSFAKVTFDSCDYP